MTLERLDRWDDVLVEGHPDVHKISDFLPDGKVRVLDVRGNNPKVVSRGQLTKYLRPGLTQGHS